MVAPDDWYTKWSQQTYKCRANGKVTFYELFEFCLKILTFSALRVYSCFLNKITNSPMFCLEKCGITVAKMRKIILWIFFNALSQSQPSNMLYFCYIPHHPPPPHTHTYFRLPTCFLLLRKSLRHLGGWFNIIHKFARDLISVHLVPDFDTISFIAIYFWVTLLQINFVSNGKQNKTVFIF